MLVMIFYVFLMLAILQPKYLSEVLFIYLTSSHHSFLTYKTAGQFWLQRNTGAGHLWRRTLQKTTMSRAWRVASSFHMYRKLKAIVTEQGQIGSFSQQTLLLRVSSARSWIGERHLAALGECRRVALLRPGDVACFTGGRLDLLGRSWYRLTDCGRGVVVHRG